MNKLTYSENIGYLHNGPKIVKRYTTSTVLIEDYENFKSIWSGIAEEEPNRHSINEEVIEFNHRVLTLTTTFNGITWTKSVEINFEEA